MPYIVAISDFLGDQFLPEDDFTEDFFDPMLDDWHDSFIYKLLGAELGKLFLADLDPNGVPQAARFLDIYNKFAEDTSTVGGFWGSFYEDCPFRNGLVESKGMKYFMKGIIWWYFARNNNVVATLAGNKTSLSENTEVNFDNGNLARNYNNAINTGKAIQWYIWDNSDVYPEFNGKHLDYQIGL